MGAAPRLSPSQLTQFARDGVLILRGVLDPELCRAARERLWDCAPPQGRVRRDRPSSWVGPWREEEEEYMVTGSRLEGPRGKAVRAGFNWQVRHLASEELLLDLVPRAVMPVAEQLMGAGTVAEPKGTRGFYCYLPRPPSVPRGNDAAGAHVDGWVNRVRLEAIGYFDDVPPGGGGFQCWPGTHLLCNDLTVVQPPAGVAAGPSGNLRPGAREFIDELARSHRKMDCHGKAGDVVLWHAKLLHCAGQNWSQQIRCAVLCNYSKTKAAVPEDREFLGQENWVCAQLLIVRLWYTSHQFPSCRNIRMFIVGTRR